MKIIDEDRIEEYNVFEVVFHGEFVSINLGSTRKFDDEITLLFTLKEFMDISIAAGDQY